jgi:hypothetical protein
MTGSAPLAAHRAGCGPPVPRLALRAAQAALAVGMASAAVSVYWGPGGSWRRLSAGRPRADRPAVRQLRQLRQLRLLRT